jgi:hypothetical protein
MELDCVGNITTVDRYLGVIKNEKMVESNNAETPIMRSCLRHLSTNSMRFTDPLSGFWLSVVIDFFEIKDG